jgi:hypothetical protein
MFSTIVYPVVAVMPPPSTVCRLLNAVTYVKWISNPALSAGIWA